MNLVTLYQRRGRYWLRYRFRGREVRQSVAALLGLPPARITARQAEQVRREREREILGGRFSGPQSDRLMVRDVLTQYLADAELRGVRALDTLKFRAAPAIAALGECRAVDLTTALLREYIAKRLAEGIASSTISLGEIGVIRAAFRLAHRDGRLRELPHFPTLPGVAPRQGFVEPEDFEALVKDLPAVVRDASTFAYLTARRIGEVCQLPWAWVDLRGGEIRWPMTKNGQPLTLPISQRMREILERRRAELPMCEWVFHSPGYTVALAENTVREWLKPSGLRPHDLRRSGVRNMIRSGVRETVAMSISGHRSRAVFDRYNISSQEDQQQAMASVEKYVGARNHGEAVSGAGSVERRGRPSSLVMQAEQGDASGEFRGAGPDSDKVETEITVAPSSLRYISRTTVRRIGGKPS